MLLLPALFVVLTACKPATRMHATETATHSGQSQGRPAGLSSTPRADVIVTEDGFGELARLSIGQTMSLACPKDMPDWQVDYDSSILVALTPAEKMRAPGSKGWRFRAKAPGETEVILTSIVSVQPGVTPIAPIPARIVIKIGVHK